MLGAARMPIRLVNVDTVNLSLLIVDTGQKNINIPVFDKMTKSGNKVDICVQI